MPSSPRSEKKFTGRDKTGPRLIPSRTRCTFPVFFSKTKKSSSPRKAMVVVVTRPVTTVLTSSLGDNMLGPPTCDINVLSLAEKNRMERVTRNTATARDEPLHRNSEIRTGLCMCTLLFKNWQRCYWEDGLAI